MHARPGAGACCCGAAVDSCQGKNLNRSIWRTERGSTTRVTPYTPDMGYRAARHTHLPAAHLHAGDQAHAVFIACRALHKDHATSMRGVPPSTTPHVHSCPQASIVFGQRTRLLILVRLRLGFPKIACKGQAPAMRSSMVCACACMCFILAAQHALVKATRANTEAQARGGCALLCPFYDDVNALHHRVNL